MNPGEQREPEREQPGAGCADALLLAFFCLMMALITAFHVLLAVTLRMN